MQFIRSIELQLILRTLVIGTLFLFIVLAERSFYKAGIRGRWVRILEITAAFIIGIAFRGLIIKIIF
jgi:hypothetical protein